MAIWTSRYSNKELAEHREKYYCVGISIGSPKFPLGYTLEQQCYSLAPKGYMLMMGKEEYQEAYLKKWEDIGADRIIGMVGRMEAMAEVEGKDLVLLCYEDVRNLEDWCHRTMFAQWYCEHTGEIIEELKDPNPPKGKRTIQTKKDSKKPATQEDAKKEDDSYQQMSLFGMAGVTI